MGSSSPSFAPPAPWSTACVTTRSLLALSPGNERMQSISLAVQQGARAYLNRQYTTIAVVGVVLFVALIFIQNIAVAVRLRDRRPALGLDRLHRHERLGARQRARRRGRARRRLAGAEGRLPRRRDHRPARRRARADRRLRLLRRAHLVLQRQPQDGGRRADRARLRRLADLGVRAGSAAASSRRPPTSAPTSSARSRRASPRTTRATRRRSPTTSATTSATAPAWRPTCSRPTRSPRSP